MRPPGDIYNIKDIHATIKCFNQGRFSICGRPEIGHRLFLNVRRTGFLFVDVEYFYEVKLFSNDLLELDPHLVVEHEV